MRRLEKKKLMVLGGASQHCKVVETAKAMGIEVYVADYLEDSPAKALADHQLMIDVMDIDSLVKICAEEKIDGAIATSLDACQLPYQQLCERMGYPCFGTKEQFQILTDKNLFKKVCREYGVDTIPEYTENDFKEENMDISYPVFVKPSDSRGSRGQSICYCRQDVLTAIENARKESKSGTVVIEKYMEGYKDFTVSYLVLDGVPYVVRTGDRFEGTKESGLSNLAIASLSPSEYTDFYYENVSKNVEAMLKGIQLNNAPFFAQGFIDGNTVRFYDPGLRFAGGEYERILKQTTGADPIRELIKIALGETPDASGFDKDTCMLNGKYLIQLDPTLLSGKISKIEGLNELMEEEAIFAVSCRYSVGEYVPASQDLKQRFGEFCIISNSKEEEKEMILKVQRELHVLDENGQEMVFDKLNVREIRKV